MNLMELKIGRDGESGKLCVTVAGKNVLAGEADSVPKSVSREHVLVTVTDEGAVILQNLKLSCRWRNNLNGHILGSLLEVNGIVLCPRALLIEYGLPTCKVIGCIKISD